MAKTYLEKSIILNKHFAVYGYGNFDVLDEEVAEIFEILEGENPEELLKELYERLKEQRMG